MSILQYFTNDKTTPIVVKRITNTFNESTGKSTESDATIGSYNAIYWTGRAAEGVVSEKIRAQVDAVIVTETTRDIQRRDVIECNGKRYNVVEVDDIANQGEVLQVSLKEIA